LQRPPFRPERVGVFVVNKLDICRKCVVKSAPVTGAGKYSLREQVCIPPEGVMFKDPVTGISVKVISISTASQEVVKLRSINSDEVANYAQVVSEITDYICEHLKSNGVQDCCVENATPDSLSLKKLASGAAAYALIKSRGQRAFVNHALATKRASVCKGCPNNRPSSRSGLSAVAARKMISAIGDRETRYDRRLGTCSSCGCPLKSKVHIAQDIVEMSLSQKEVDACPPKCWMIKNLEQSAGAAGKSLSIAGISSCSTCGG